MAVIKVSETTKSLIVLAINLVATLILGLAAIYGWELALWQPITAMVVLMLDTVLGIRWIVPTRKSIE